MNRRVYRDLSGVPRGVKVLGVRVQVPRVLFATDEGVQDDLTLHETTMVYVEITEEEWEHVRNDQAAINALGQSLGPEIADFLGGYVKAWN
jgi:hypothetical protein